VVVGACPKAPSNERSIWDSTQFEYVAIIEPPIIIPECDAKRYSARIALATQISNTDRSRNAYRYWDLPSDAGVIQPEVHSKLKADFEEIAKMV